MRRWEFVMVVTATIHSSRFLISGFSSIVKFQKRTKQLSTIRYVREAPISWNNNKLYNGRRRILQSKFFSTTDLTSEERKSLEEQIKAKGDEIRSLKGIGTDKAIIAPLVEELQSLKRKLDPTSGSESIKPKSVQQKQQPTTKKSSSSKQTNSDGTNDSDNNDEGGESDFITAREVDYSKWYNDLIRVTGLAEPSPVRGCMVIKPLGMSIWDRLRNELDERIKNHGAENAYFPLLIPKSFLAKEAEHVDGFAKECAVVTHHRLKVSDEEDGGDLIVDPDAKLEDPLIVRPTSETMIWYMFRKWIVSYRDLPLKVNQWANVMRWEMRTRPFLRTSEFLWQEGHTAHATSESARQDAMDALELYGTVCETLLAMPVVRGVKSPSERFAGALETYTIEALMQNGWALQSGTSHFLGQSFGKAFDVTFQDENGQQQDVWGASWGVSTRLIGALIMTHSDNAGLVLPPRIAPIQVVIVPIPPKKDDTEAIELINHAITKLMNELKEASVRVKLDDRDFVRSGAKFFEWERKGIPLRIEIGPRDARNNACVMKYRAGNQAEQKITVDLEQAAITVKSGLDTMQQDMYDLAFQRLQDGITSAIDRDVTYDEMKDALESDEASSYPGKGLYLVPWKCDAANENKIKEECKATIRCYPLDANQKGLCKGKKCFYSGDDATHMALFGRAF